MKEKIFTIDNIYFIIAIALLTFWLTFVTAKGGLTNHTYTRQWWKRITNRGKIAGFILIALPIVLVLQEVNNRSISSNDAIDLKNAQDSTANRITQGIKKGVQKETDKLFENLSIAFNKQGLQYDTIKKEVIKLRDSVKVVNNFGETPNLNIKSLKIIDSTTFGSKTYKIEYEIFSEDAKSLDIDIKCDIFAFTPNLELRTISRNLRLFYTRVKILESKVVK